MGLWVGSSTEACVDSYLCVSVALPCGAFTEPVDECLISRNNTFRWEIFWSKPSLFSQQIQWVYHKAAVYFRTNRVWSTTCTSQLPSSIFKSYPRPMSVLTNVQRVPGTLQPTPKCWGGLFDNDPVMSESLTKWLIQLEEPSRAYECGFSFLKHGTHMTSVPISFKYFEGEIYNKSVYLPSLEAP